MSKEQSIASPRYKPRRDLCLTSMQIYCIILRYGMVYSSIVCYTIYRYIWVVVKIMVPFWVPIIIRHLIFRVPKKGP